MAKRTKREIKTEKVRVYQEAVQGIALLCSMWEPRHMTASTGGETMDDLLPHFANAWGHRVVQDSWHPLSADNLTEDLAEVLMNSHGFSQDQVFHQCGPLSAVWRSWTVMADFCSLSPSASRLYHWLRTREIPPEAAGHN